MLTSSFLLQVTFQRSTVQVTVLLINKQAKQCPLALNQAKTSPSMPGDTAVQCPMCLDVRNTVTCPCDLKNVTCKRHLSIQAHWTGLTDQESDCSCCQRVTNLILITSCQLGNWIEYSQLINNNSLKLCVTT